LYTKNPPPPNFGTFFEGLREWKTLVYFMTIWYFKGYLMYFTAVFKKLSHHTLAGFDLTTHSSESRFETTRPRHHLVYFVVIDIYSPILVCCTKKNLATLKANIRIFKQKKGDNQGGQIGRILGLFADCFLGDSFGKYLSDNFLPTFIQTQLNSNFYKIWVGQYRSRDLGGSSPMREDGNWEKVW
jgi:hypothetical protein